MLIEERQSSPSYVFVLNRSGLFSLSGPCAPVSVAVRTGCAIDSAVVGWDPSQGAISYYVYAVSTKGNVSCQSTTPTCVLTNLTCGSTYSAYVVAVGNSCSSVPSQVMALNTGNIRSTL